MDAPQPEIRVGDRERREVDDRLRAALDDGVLTLTEYDERAALCWAARTRADLDALVRDLPPPHPAEQATDVLPTPAPAPAVDHHARKRLATGVVGVAVAAVALLFGVPALGAADGMSLFGSREITATDQPEVEVGVLFGSVEIVVPDGVRAQTSGTVVFGSIDCDQACNAPGEREVVINGGGAFGSVDVVTASERDQDRREHMREEHEDERED